MKQQKSLSNDFQLIILVLNIDRFNRIEYGHATATMCVLFYQVMKCCLSLKHEWEVSASDPFIYPTVNLFKNVNQFDDVYIQINEQAHLLLMSTFL